MFNLPTDPKTRWIPAEFATYYEQLQEHAAWYAGDTGDLISFYSTSGTTPRANGSFWGENVKANDNRSIVHVPIAGDIASFAADLLFSESPDIQIPEAHERNEKGERIENERAERAEKRLWNIIDGTGVISRLVEAAETSAAMGGVFLKPTWDSELSDMPILSIAQPDNAIPAFRHGFLVSVIFHKIIKTVDSKVYRLLEHYTTGQIESALYEGDQFTIGRRVPLNYLTETEKITPILLTQIPDILCRYIPNKRPHKRFRGSNLGMSDIQGTETLMDALDMVMSSWMRDIALGRGRIHVPQDMLDENGRFDAGQEAYVNLDIDPSMMGDNGNFITATQFAIRTAEHNATATELITQILHMSGYAPQSFGLNVGSNISTDTAEIRERKTMVTKQKKEQHFAPGLEDTLKLMLMIDNIHLNHDTPTEFKPVVTFADTIGQDIKALAATVGMLKTAQAASIQTRVEMIHPEWTAEQVAEEVERIKTDEGMNVDSPLSFGGKVY